MASISKQPSGRKTIQFVAPNRKRRSVRLGKMNQRDAEAFRTKLEALLSANLVGQPFDGETSRWLGTLDKVMIDRLAAVGLIPRRDVLRVTLAEFLDGYIDGRTDIKPRTREQLTRTRDYLVAFFGKGKTLSDVNPGEADAFRLHLLEKQQENTVRRTCGRAKQFFRAAVRRKLVADNPFADLASSVRGNPGRFYFISRDEAQRVLEACPDVQWRLLFALSRYGGMRCPSEHLALRWGDIDWQHGRMTVTSPKTEHHAGGGSRQVPLFPELRAVLAEAFDLAEEGAEFVITRYRSTNANMRTQFERIIRKAGLTPWPKLFQNLRATRETELAEEFPMHVVCKWIGNSVSVANRHYLQLTDEHFERAKGPALDLESALHIPVQQTAELACLGLNTPEAGSDFSRENSGVQFSAPPKAALLRLELDSVTGCADNDLRQSPISRAAYSGAVSSPNGAVEGANGAQEPASGDGLQRVVEAWPSLPEATRRRILSLVEKGGKR